MKHLTAMIRIETAHLQALNDLVQAQSGEVSSTGAAAIIQAVTAGLSKLAHDSVATGAATGVTGKDAGDVALGAIEVGAEFVGSTTVGAAAAIGAIARSIGDFVGAYQGFEILASAFDGASDELNELQDEWDDCEDYITDLARRRDEILSTWESLLGGGAKPAPAR